MYKNLKRESIVLKAIIIGEYQIERIARNQLVVMTEDVPLLDKTQSVDNPTENFAEVGKFRLKNCSKYKINCNSYQMET